MSSEQVYVTDKALHRPRSTHRLHWEGRRAGWSGCTGHVLALFGEDPARIAPEDRCRANGCWQRWAQFDRERAGGAS